MLLLFTGNLAYTYAQTTEDTSLYRGNKKNAWKVDAIGFFVSTTVLGYERFIRPNFSLEGNVGIIGMGKDPHGNRPRGALIKFGPRFLRTSPFRFRSRQFNKLLRSAYFQPQLIFGIHDSNYPYYRESPGFFNFLEEVHYAREITRYGGILLIGGNQFVYANSFLIDFYGGIGVGFDKTTRNNQPLGWHDHDKGSYTYGFLVLPEGYGEPIALQLGIKIGFLTK